MKKNANTIAFLSENSQSEGKKQKKAIGYLSPGKPKISELGIEDYAPLNTLKQNQAFFTIKVRVTKKSEITKYSKVGHEGHMFAVNLKDCYGNEIRAIAFAHNADAFFPILIEGKVYAISGGRVKEENSKFSV